MTVFFFKKPFFGQKKPVFEMPLNQYWLSGIFVKGDDLTTLEYTKKCYSFFFNFK